MGFNALIDNEVWAFPSRAEFLKWKNGANRSRTTLRDVASRVASVDVVWASFGSGPHWVQVAKSKLEEWRKNFVRACNAIEANEFPVTYEELSVAMKEIEELIGKEKLLSECRPRVPCRIKRHVSGTLCEFTAWREADGTVHVLDADGKLQLCYPERAENLVVDER